MSKFNVYVPAVGQRDAVLSYFAGNGVFYLFDIAARVAETEFPAGTAEAVLEEAGADLAMELVAGSDQGYAGTAGAYEFVKDGVLLGWQVEVRLVPFDDDEGLFQ